jgi:predicted metalloprotease with PDZ domain
MEGGGMRLWKRAALALALVTAVSGVPLGHASGQTQESSRRAARPQGWIGITIDLDLQQAWQAGAPAPTPSMVIAEVFDGSPADRAGLEVGDTILRINQRPVSEDEIARLQSSLEPGNNVRFQFRRGGRNRSVSVRAAARPSDDVLQMALSPQIRLQVQSAQAVLLDQLDSARRFGRLASGGEEGGRTLFTFRTPDDSVVLSFPGAPGMAPFPGGDAFDRTWTVSVRPRSSSFEGVLSGQAPAGSAVQQVRRPGPEVAARQAALEAMRVEAGATRALARVEEHRRPLAPYILGKDVIAGAKLAPMNPELADYFGVSRGLLVVDVVDGTLAADAGVLSGDVIVSSGQRGVSTVEELRAVFASARGARSVPLTLIRKGRRLQVYVPR